MKYVVAFLLGCLLFIQPLMAQGPKVLVVTAHPDDESGMAATIYKITHELNGLVDQCVITNGEGGYKYSTLAESYYGLELTNEKIGRANLPRIRKQELMNAAKIIGTNNIFFLDQKDAKYGLDEHEPLDTSWNVPWVLTRLKAIVTTTHYDYVFCLVPDTTTHGGHKAATLLALRTVQSLPVTERPIILGVSVESTGDTTKKEFAQLRNYTESKMYLNKPMFSVDRTKPIGYKGRLNYKMIVNWEIAEHKSQGTMQMFMNLGDNEQFWYFDINGKENIAKCQALFKQLETVPYKVPEY